jgi:hypothetical protein
MGFMALDYFRQSPLLAMPVLALVIFMLVFALITLRAFWVSKARWDEVARLPLESDAEADGSER